MEDFPDYQPLDSQPGVQPQQTPMAQQPQPFMQPQQPGQFSQHNQPTQYPNQVPLQPNQPISPSQPTPQPIESNQPEKNNNNPTKPIKPRGPWMVIAIIFIILSLILGGAFGWAFMQYLDYRDNTNYKISQAVADEQKRVSTEMQKKFAEEAKSPYALFVGPDDYGRVSFEYPKTWSVFVSSEVSSGTSNPFKAFFYPDVVPPVSETQQFALRMTIEDMDYDKAVNRYQNLIKKGDLSSEPVQVGLLNGTRLNGMFTKDIRGSAVMFKVRDKTLTLRTDSNAFMADFDKLVQTIQVTE